MQLEARPARPFSTTHTVKGCCGEIARLSVGAFRDGGELTFAHQRYRIRPQRGGFVLEGGEGVLATARAYSGRRGYEIAYAGHRLTIEPVMSLRNGYLISEGVARRGAVRRRTPPFVRGLDADLNPDVPIDVQLFIAWLMLAPAARPM